MLKLTTEAELAALHGDNVRENLHLEYKASAALNIKKDDTKIEMARDVSAFANSDGGQIVYGMKENKDHDPDGLDDGLDPSKYTPIWFDTVLQRYVAPKLHGITYRHVPLQSGGVAIVLTIPKSDGEPHQVEHKYFRRHSFNRLPMEHYEVRDAFNRQTAPSLFVEASIREQHTMLQFETPASLSGLVTLELFIGNRSNTPAMYTAVHLHIDERLVVQSAGGLQFFAQSGGSRIYTKKIGLPSGFPIFKEQLFSLNDQSFNVQFPYVENGRSQFYDVKARVLSPGFAGDQHWRIRQVNYRVSIQEQVKLSA